MCVNLVEIIEENEQVLATGQAIKVLFEDGFATIFKENQRVITLLEAVDYRLIGSIHDYRKD